MSTEKTRHIKQWETNSYRTVFNSIENVFHTRNLNDLEHWDELVDSVKAGIGAKAGEELRKFRECETILNTTIMG